MSRDTSPETVRDARERLEADLVRLRTSELHESPIRGEFDLKHLRAVHAWLLTRCMSRDVEVLERAYPGLTEERAMATDDRAECETWWQLEKLRAMRGASTLERIITKCLGSGP